MAPLSPTYLLNQSSILPPHTHKHKHKPPFLYRNAVKSAPLLVGMFYLELARLLFLVFLKDVYSYKWSICASSCDRNGAPEAAESAAGFSFAGRSGTTSPHQDGSLWINGSDGSHPPCWGLLCSIRTWEMGARVQCNPLCFTEKKNKNKTPFTDRNDPMRRPIPTPTHPERPDCCGAAGLSLVHSQCRVWWWITASFIVHSGVEWGDCGFFIIISRVEHFMTNWLWKLRLVSRN